MLGMHHAVDYTAALYVAELNPHSKFVLSYPLPKFVRQMPHKQVGLKNGLGKFTTRQKTAADKNTTHRLKFFHVVYIHYTKVRFN